LCEFASEVNGRDPTLSTINKVLTKLEEYNTKLTSLATKLNVRGFSLFFLSFAQFVVPCA